MRSMHLREDGDEHRVGHFLAFLSADGTLKVIKTDPAFEQIYGGPFPKEVDLYSFEDELARALEPAIFSLVEGKSFSTEVERNGRYLFLSIFPLEDGPPTKVVGTLVDATARRRQYLLMKAAEVLSKSSGESAAQRLRELLAPAFPGVEIEVGSLSPVNGVGPDDEREAYYLPLGQDRVLIFQGRHLDTEEKLFLDRLAQVVELAEERNRALEVAKRREEAYHQLLSIANNLESETDPERIIEMTLEFILDITGMDVGVFARVAGKLVRPELMVGGHKVGLAERFAPPDVLRLAVKKAFREQRVIEELATKPVSMGEYQFYSLAVAPVWVSDRPYGVIELFSTRPWGLSDEEREIFALSVRRLGRMLERVEYLKELERTREAVLQSFGRILEQRDLETRGHTERVVRMTEYLGRRFGFRG